MDDVLSTILTATGLSTTTLGQSLQSLTSSATLNNIFMVVVTLYLSLKLLGMAYRTIMSFIWWAAVLMFLVLGFWTYQQGLGTVVGTLWGFAGRWWDQAEKVVDENAVLKMGKAFLEQQSQGVYEEVRRGL
ncbi:hypothetical protein EX30DRAFT_364979 [Ascodesmis nigricans]|uniref:Uncharacterized protein n=1 Tax=Ascodesmis nigricans TaxID=341454 RepID=A0A4S2MT98_9PEZI|nr:hypothetical protein EX30DRAFT_364979 [Ascodesmis nigricans]